MPTREQAEQLIREYEPILYLHPEERYIPVMPDVYVQHSALWHSQPASHDKRDWGIRPPTDREWPRAPLIPKRGISVNPAHDIEGSADPDGDGVNEWYLGHQEPDGRFPYLTSNPERELFLDFAGWADGEAVDETSENIAPNKDLAATNYETVRELQDSGFWCCAEVEDLDTLTGLLASISKEERLDLETAFREVFGQAWLIWYYFFYPIHEEVTRHCGEIIGAGSDGDYEGDWAAVGVIVRQPATLPWESGGEFTNPEFVGFSRRTRGLLEIPFTFLRQEMQVRAWHETAHVGRHVKVYVARGSHNNYSIEGPKHPPAVPLSSATCEGLEDVDEEVRERLDDIGETVDNIETALVTVAKVGGGCGVGAILGSIIPAIGTGLGCLAGAAVGGIAAGIEALVDDSEDSSETVDERVREEAERDYPPDEDNYGTIIAPADLVGTLPDEAHAAAVEPWRGTPGDKLVDRALQIWWPSGRDLEGNFHPGYNGRWGVKVQEDGYDRRSGIVFPPFKQAFLIDLALHLSR